MTWSQTLRKDKSSLALHIQAASHPSPSKKNQLVLEDNRRRCEKEKRNCLKGFWLREDAVWQSEFGVSSNGHHPAEPRGSARGSGRLAKLQSRGRSSGLWDLRLEPGGEEEEATARSRLAFQVLVLSSSVYEGNIPLRLKCILTEEGGAFRREDGSSTALCCSAFSRSVFCLSTQVGQAPGALP